ncbi:hypothetical protein [Calothrix sp. 336/3]|uniref:hypothetical protein n=1 Tax=Calothrix sp. 336/3 TaxID=1337936 RepID=UPI0004E344DC|nr:hypothetical protein [Calothrix sp. 336/3]AKG24639.1 hypothetical protein IJ00_14070 [Calothrix sp. 336/3]
MGYLKIWCFVRKKFSPWLTLAIAPIKLCCSSGMKRTQEEIRCMVAMSKIDFVGVYAVLNDLLW